MSVLWGQVLLISACLALIFFLSGFEAGVFALNRLRLRQWSREGDRRAKRLLEYLERPERFLWTIFVGNALANFTAIYLFLANLRTAAGGHVWLFWGGFVGTGFVAYATCELLPKTLFRQFPNRLCLSLLGPFRVVHFLISPIVFLIEWFAHQVLRWSGGAAFSGGLFANREELRQLMLENSGSLSPTEKRLINRVLDLQNVTVGQIARPLAQATTVEDRTPVQEVLRLCRERHLTRLPVWTGVGVMRRIAGIITLKTLLYTDLPEGARAGEFVRPSLYLDGSTRLEEALRRLQRSGHHFAIVLGPDRREFGLVTLWDILRAVFGGEG